MVGRSSWTPDFQQKRQCHGRCPQALHSFSTAGGAWVRPSLGKSLCRSAQGRAWGTCTQLLPRVPLLPPSASCLWQGSAVPESRRLPRPRARSVQRNLCAFHHQPHCRPLQARAVWDRLCANAAYLGKGQAGPRRWGNFPHPIHRPAVHAGAVCGGRLSRALRPVHTGVSPLMPLPTQAFPTTRGNLPAGLPQADKVGGKAGRHAAQDAHGLHALSASCHFPSPLV